MTTGNKSHTAIPLSCSRSLYWFSLTSFKVHNMYRDRILKKTPKTVGVWSAWSPWTACSRSCGGGITQQTRHCVTRPADSRLVHIFNFEPWMSAIVHVRDLLLIYCIISHYHFHRIVWPYVMNHSPSKNNVSVMTIFLRNLLSYQDQIGLEQDALSWNRPVILRIDAIEGLSNLIDLLIKCYRLICRAGSASSMMRCGRCADSFLF